MTIQISENEKINNPINELYEILSNSEPLESEFKKVYYDNAWDLYEN